MSEVLFDTNLICEIDLKTYKNLIHKILSNELTPPNVKIMKGLSYHDNSVFRAKINDKERLIYTYLNYNGKKTLCILAKNDHNYGRLKRQLKTKNSSHIDSIQLQEEESKLLSDESELKFIPAVSYQKSMIAWDDLQKKGHLYNDSMIFSGPPGAGKTLILYNNMLRALYAQQTTIQLPILFLSKSKNLLNILREDYQSLGLEFKVNFINWNDYLSSFYPGKKTVSKEIFKTWLADQNWETKHREVHYELGLIVALGEKKYLTLGNRQCHFLNEKPRLISLLKKWQDYLSKINCFDPLISIPTEIKQNYLAIFSDETQNLPPAALSFLIKSTKQYIASLDTEQGLLSSPLIHNCLKELFHSRFKNYEELQLENTWRCPPEIIAVGNHLMNAKHCIDGGRNRRNYKEVKSMLPEGSGNISWIDEQHLSMLKDHCSPTKTVVIVKKITEELRKIINEKLGINHILTPKKGLGQEFDHIILWDYFTDEECFHELSQRKILQGSGLNLEQLYAINAIYVSLTRSQKMLYIYDDLARKRFTPLLKFLLGELPLNQFSKTEKVEESKIQWLTLIKNYMDDGDYKTARQLMSYHLGYQDSAIDQIIKASLPKEIKTTINTTKPSSTTNNTPISTSKSTKTPEPQKPKKIQLTAEQKRIEEFYARFSQKTLLELFNAKDGMKLLFETPTENFCLFSRCIADSAKYHSFKKFIKEHGKIAADKLRPYRIIEAKIYFKNQEMTLLSYLFLHKKQELLHLLFEKYSLPQRLIFACDSYTYSPAHHWIKNDETIQLSLNCDIETLEPYKEELIQILCAPTSYDPKTSYLYQLASYQLGLIIIFNLINNKEIRKHVCDNFYAIPPQHQTSLFYKFVTHYLGVETVIELFTTSPSLLQKLSIDDLFAKNPRNKPIIFQYLLRSKDNEYHSLLNMMISTEIAAKIPHDLVDIYLLSHTSAGIKIINRMLDAQEKMIAQMTGAVITTTFDSTEFTIFSLLSMQQEEGAALLNRLLDFHGQDFIDELSDAALCYHPNDDSFRTAYADLMETIEGQIFLKIMLMYKLKRQGNPLEDNLTLIDYARKTFPLPAQCSFFATSKAMYELSELYRAKPIDILLWHLSKNNTKQVEKMVLSTPSLLLEKGTFVDESGKRYKNISPLNFCTLNGYDSLHGLMIDLLENNVEGRRILKNLLISVTDEVKGICRLTF